MTTIPHTPLIIGIGFSCRYFSQPFIPQADMILSAQADPDGILLVIHALGPSINTLSVAAGM